MNNTNTTSFLSRKFTSVLLLIVMCLTCFTTACNKKSNKDIASSTDTNSTNSVANESSSPATSIATPTPTEIPTPTPTPTPDPTPIPTPTPEYIEPTIDEVWYNGFVDPRSVRAEIVTNPDDVTVLVNKYYALPVDYIPSDLVKASHSFDQSLRADAAAAWEQMYLDCLEETGQGLLLVSGYRDSGTQQYLFDRSRNKNGLAFACQKNAIPGRSEHQLGLALDITPAGHDNIMDGFDETKVGKWVCENGHKYGIIHRYKAEFVYETGYGIEGWHFRYVGVELATYLYENHMSLEAYYGKQQVTPWEE